MKSFVELKFDLAQIQKELHLFSDLLKSNLELDERKQILPFFNENRHLANFIGVIDSKISIPNKYALEYDLFSDFKADLAMGDSYNNYLFVEFEDAKENSIFKKNGKKETLEWSSRFEHGYSQIIDWFWKLNDMRQTGNFKHRFGSDLSNYSGLLVIGRTEFLEPVEQERLKWRKDYVLVNSKLILCMTYDELYENLKTKLDLYIAIGNDNYDISAKTS